MCWQRPCKCSVKMFEVPDHAFWDVDGKPRPGAFAFVNVKDGEHMYVQLEVVLPCEGGELHGLPIAPANPSGWNKAQWSVSGSLERPTLSPSVRTGERDYSKPDRPIICEHWHGYVVAGELKSC